MQESPQAPAPSQPAPAAPSQAPASPANFSEAFSQAVAKHSGSPASATPPPAAKADDTPSAPSAPAAQQPAAPKSQTVPMAAYAAERQKRQDLHAQFIAAENKLKAVEAELAKLRTQPPPATTKAQTAEDKWLAELADDPDDRVSKIAKEFEDYRKLQDEKWQQVEARQQAAIAEQQDTQLTGLLDILHDRLPKLPGHLVDHMAQTLLLAEPEGSERTLEEVLLPLWELHQTMTAAPKPEAKPTSAAPQAQQPKPPPQIGAPSAPAQPAQTKLHPSNLAAYLSERMRQMSQ